MESLEPLAPGTERSPDSGEHATPEDRTPIAVSSADLCARPGAFANRWVRVHETPESREELIWPRPDCSGRCCAAVRERFFYTAASAIVQVGGFFRLDPLRIQVEEAIIR